MQIVRFSVEKTSGVESSFFFLMSFVVVYFCTDGMLKKRLDTQTLFVLESSYEDINKRNFFTMKRKRKQNYNLCFKDTHLLNVVLAF